MGVSTLNGLRVTSARVNIPAWGLWYAEAHLDGEHTLTGSVTLKIADLTLVGTVLSGGPRLGRSSYRIVAGGGGWGRALPKKSYANDAGVKVSTVVGDAAREVGETVDTISSSLRVGSSFERIEGDPASRVLQAVADQAWYVDEAGVTHLGARAAGALVGKVTRLEPVDLSRGKVVLAAESIATILPGVVVDGLAAVDVLHEVSAQGGLRSTVWGSQAPGSLSTLAKLAQQLDPDRAFRSVSEYRVDTRNGDRLNLQPVRVSTGLPELKNVPVRPGVSGCDAVVALGSRVLVGFIDGDRTRPFVQSFEDPEGDNFQPTSLTLNAGEMAGGEHLMTVEATALLMYNFWVAVLLVSGAGPVIGTTVQPLLGAAMTTALAAQAVPAPPTAVAQIAAAAALQAGFAAGTTPSNAMFAAWTSAIAALSTKTANESGSFPSVGCKAVKGG